MQNYHSVTFSIIYPQKNKQKIVDYRKICVILQTKTNEVIRCEKLHFYNNVFLYNIEYNSINLITRERFLWKKDS